MGCSLIDGMYGFSVLLGKENRTILDRPESGIAGAFFVEQVFLPVGATFNWRNAGLGIRGVSSIQIRETARVAARPLGGFQVAAKFSWRDAGLGIRVGFFDPDLRNGSRGRSPSRYFLRLPQNSVGGMPASASAWGSSILIGETAREAARPPGGSSGCRNV